MGLHKGRSGMRLGRSGMRLHRSRMWIVAVLAFGTAAVPAMASTEPLTVEAVNEQSANCPYVYGYGYTECHHWSNATQTISAGQKVTFSNLSTPGVPHGIEWRSSLHGECEKGGAGEGNVPVGTTEAASATNWSGKCKFTQPGVYTFWCTRHHQEMSGTITVPGTPKAKTIPASGENQTEAMLNGSIEPEGNAVEYLFEYGIASASESKTSPVGLGATDFVPHSVAVPVSGLLPKTTYHFKLVATYGVGKTPLVTGEQTFTTPAAAPPTLATGEATVKGEKEATLKGTVDPNGGGSTEYFFEYAPAAEYEATKTYKGKTTAVGGLLADNAVHQASTTVSQLQPGTTYHYRIVASNEAGGPVMGADRTFKTLSPPPPKEEPTPTPTTTNPTPTPTPTPGPISPEPEVAPLVPPIAQGSLKLVGAPHGGHPTVRVSLSVSQSGAGDRLEIDLLARSSSLTGHGHSRKLVNVGRVVRASISAGKLSLSVALNTRGRDALRRSHKLALILKVILTRGVGAPVSQTHAIVLRS
jgi:plastocyanin